MAAILKRLENEATKLPARSRARLAELLLASLDACGHAPADGGVAASRGITAVVALTTNATNTEKRWKGLRRTSATGGLDQVSAMPDI
jgi:hypothetical protein